MKLAIHTSAFRSYSLQTALEEISSLGYEYVELSANLSETSHFAAHGAGEKEIRGLRRDLEAFNLKPIAIDIGGWDPPLCLANLNESERVAAVRNVKQAIRAAGDLGCPLITSHLWGLPIKRDLRTESWHREAFKTSVEELSPLLEDRDVRLNFMPHPGGFIEESDPTVDLIRDTECRHIGYTYGIGHTFVISLPGQGAAHMIEYAGKTLTHVLISDTYRPDRIIAPPEVKAHLHLVPGKGDIDFPAVLSALKGIGYTHFLSVHIISESDRIGQAAEQTKRELEKFLSAADL